MKLSTLMERYSKLCTMCYNDKHTKQRFPLPKPEGDSYFAFGAVRKTQIILPPKSSISDALEDGFLSNSELTSLLNIFKRLTDPVDNFDSCCNESQSHKLNFVGKNVCLTGDFTYGSKQEIASILASNGAVLQNSVTKQTDILVVGGCGSDKWTNGSYGGKIKKAMEYNEKGIDIKIIKECEISYLLEGVLCVSR